MTKLQKEICVFLLGWIANLGIIRAQEYLGLEWCAFLMTLIPLLYFVLYFIVCKALEQGHGR